MSKITNDDLIQSGTGCFIAVTIWQKLGAKGLTLLLFKAVRSCDKASNPVYVSPGHLISMDTAVWLVKLCSHYRVPEPIRQVQSAANLSAVWSPVKTISPAEILALSDNTVHWIDTSKQ